MARLPHPALVRAKARLDRLDFYPRPVRLTAVRLVVAPWLFRLPWLRRFDGYATHLVIFLRVRAYLDDDDLVTHELCHVGMPLSYLRRYASNPYELEARRAVEQSAG